MGAFRLSQHFNLCLGVIADRYSSRESRSIDRGCSEYRSIQQYYTGRGCIRHDDSLLVGLFARFQEQPERLQRRRLGP